MTTVQAFDPMKKEDIAKVLAVSLRTVENWVKDGTLPEPQRIGSRVYWHPRTFYRWLDDRLLGEVAIQSPMHKPLRESSRSARPEIKSVEGANWNDTL